MKATVWALILASLSASAEFQPIRPAFEPGRTGGVEPMVLRPKSLAARTQGLRNSERAELEDRWRDVERAHSALAGAHGQARRNLEKLTARELSARVGIDKAVSEGAVKQADAVDLRRNIERAVREFRKAAEKMDAQRMEGNRQ